MAPGIIHQMYTLSRGIKASRHNDVALKSVDQSLKMVGWRKLAISKEGQEDFRQHKSEFGFKPLVVGDCPSDDDARVPELLQSPAKGSRLIPAALLVVTEICYVNSYAIGGGRLQTTLLYSISLGSTSGIKIWSRRPTCILLIMEN